MEIQLKQKHLNSISSNFVYDYLKNLDMDEYTIQAFLNEPNEDCCDKWQTLANIKKGLSLLNYSIESHDKIFLQIDSDNDGFTSASIIYLFLKEHYPTLDIIYRIHEGKQHGIIIDTIPEDCNLIIIPDASATINQLQQLECMKKKVIVLDHHEIDYSSIPQMNNIVIINNQIKPFRNPDLSGAGVCWLFIKGYDETYFPNDQNYHRYTDLAAWGIIGDCMDTRNCGNQYIIYNGLNNLNNKFLQILLYLQGSQSSLRVVNPEKPTKFEIAWYIVPIINGVIRSGTQEEKEMVFKAFIGLDDNIPITTIYRGLNRVETIYDYAARIATNAKSRQDSNKLKCFEWLKEKINNENLNTHNIIIINLEDKEQEKINSNIVGVVAIEIATFYNKPTLILKNNNNYCSGSGRNLDNYNFPSFMDFLEQSRLCKYVQGHKNAFGVCIQKENINLLLELSDKIIKKEWFENSIEYVDYFYQNSRIYNSDMFLDLASHREIYGNGIPTAHIGFEFDCSEVEWQEMGAKKDTLKIKKNNLDFILFKASKIIEQLKFNKNNHILLVGKPTINEWLGKIKPQIFIEKIEIKEIETKIKSLRSLI